MPIHHFVDKKFAIEKVTPLILRVVKLKQRKNCVFRVRPELNLALSNNPASPASVLQVPEKVLPNPAGELVREERRETVIVLNVRRVRH